MHFGRLCLAVATLLFLSLRALLAGTQPQIDITDASGRQGDDVVVRVLLDLPEAVEGWVVDVCHDPEEDLQAINVELTGAAAAVGADLFQWNADEDFVVIGVVIDDDLTPPDELTAGDDQEVHTITYAILAEGPAQAALNFCDTGFFNMGGPTQKSFVVVNGMIVDQDQQLGLDPGAVDILATPAMRVTEATGEKGENVEVRVLFDAPEVQGWVVAICYNSSDLELAQIFFGDAVEPLMPDFVDVDEDMNGFFVGVIMDLSGNPQGRVLPPGKALEAHVVTFTIKADGPKDSVLDLCDGTIGIPAQDNRFVVEGLSVRVADGLVLEDGVVHILAPPPAECPPSFTCRADQDQKTVSLSWGMGQVPGPVEYELRRDGELIETLPAGVLAFEDTPELGFSSMDVPFNYELTSIFVAGNPVCEPLECTAVIVPDPICFKDDFDDYGDDDNLVAVNWTVEVEGDPANPLANAAWTVTNPGRRGNPPTLNGRPTQGQFVISDARAARTMQNAPEDPPGLVSHNLVSRPFDCDIITGEVWLHFDTVVKFGVAGNASFDVDVRDVSPGGAEDWLTVFQRVARARSGATLDNTGNRIGRVDIDISGALTDRRDIQFRFRFVQPTTDCWTAVDNVFVNATRGIAAVTPQTTILLEEDFVGGYPEGCVPASGDWRACSLKQHIGEDTWNTSDPCTRSLRDRQLTVADGKVDDATSMEGKFSMMDSHCGPAHAEEELLITEPIDCTGFVEVFLVLKEELFWREAVQEILVGIVRSDGGREFDPCPVYTYNNSLRSDLAKANSFSREMGFPARFAIGKADVIFAFLFQTTAGGKGWWAVDDVIVWGSESPGDLKFIRGDANCDNGDLNIADATTITGYLFQGSPPELCCRPAADTNLDGGVDLSDAIFLLGYLFVGTVPPPPPLLACETLMEHSDISLIRRQDILMGVDCREANGCPPP